MSSSGKISPQKYPSNKSTSMVVIFIFALVVFSFVRENRELSIMFIILGIIPLTLLGLLIRFKEAIIVYSAIFPFIPVIYGFDLGYNIPYLSVSRIVLALILVAVMLKGYFLRPPTANHPVFRPFVAFVIILSLNVLLSEIPSLSLNTYLAIVIEWLIFSLLIFKIIETQADIEVFVNAFSVAFVLVVVLGIFEFISNSNPIYGNYNLIQESGSQTRNFIFDYSTVEALQSRLGLRRIQSVFNHPYAFSNMGVVAFFVFLSIYNSCRRLRYLALAFVALFPVFAGLSRTSLVFFGSALVVFACFNRKRKLRSMIAILLVSVVFLVVVLMVFPGAGDLSVLVSLHSMSEAKYGSTIEQRSMMLENGLRLLGPKLLFGYGLQVPGYYLSPIGGAWLKENIGFLEIAWLSWVLSIGLSGLAIFWYMYYKFLSFSIKIHAKRANYFSHAFIAILIGSFINDMIGTQTPYQFIFILGAIAIKDITISPKR
jgi:hypothetical protein